MTSKRRARSAVRKLRPAKLRNALRRRWFEWRLARPALHHAPGLVELGTAYGGWIVPGGLIEPAWLCYSIGAGGDIGFDLELIRRYGMTVRCFDAVAGYVEDAIRDAGGESRFSARQAAIAAADGPVRMQRTHDPVSRSVSSVGLYESHDYVELPGRSLPSLNVSLGGFTPDADMEARTSEIRRITLIDRNQLLDPWTGHYERIPDERQKLLPLKAVHNLARELDELEHQLQMGTVEIEVDRCPDADPWLGCAESTDTLSPVRRMWQGAKRSAVSFYDDQGTHHAAALTYYALMSLFPTLLLAVSLLGLLGEFPATYNAIVGHLRGVVPAATLAPLDAAVRAALKSKGTAAVAFVAAIVTALYGATGYLEAARRALNVVFRAKQGRSFVRRKLIDIASTFVLMTLLLATLVLVFAGGGVAHDVIGAGASSVWRIVRWPGAFASALLVFSFVYYVTPDVQQRAFRWVTPGALVGVAMWLAASAAFSAYLANFKSFNVTYGSFTAAIVLLFWLWLTNVALVFGAEVNAQIECAKEISDARI